MTHDPAYAELEAEVSALRAALSHLVAEVERQWEWLPSRDLRLAVHGAVKVLGNKVSV